MQKIAKEHLLSPGICTLCEGAPVEGQEVVDTLRDLVSPFVFKLRGRKYVCDSCIIALGNVIGLVSNEQASRFEQRAVEAEAKVNAVFDHVAKFAKQFEQGVLERVSETAPIVETVEDVVEAVAEPAVPAEPATPVEPEVTETPEVVEEAPVEDETVEAAPEEVVVKKTSTRTKKTA